MISIFDMFKVGIGPSSSHTVGPMKAGKQFVDDLVEKGLIDDVTRVAVDVYGSLSLTGKGHHTDIAIIMGLAGNQPDTVDIDAIPAFIRDVETRGRLLLAARVGPREEVACGLRARRVLRLGVHEDEVMLVQRF